MLKNIITRILTLLAIIDSVMFTVKVIKYQKEEILNTAGLNDDESKFVAGGVAAVMVVKNELTILLKISGFVAIIAGIFMGFQTGLAMFFGALYWAFVWFPEISKLGFVRKLA